MKRFTVLLVSLAALATACSGNVFSMSAGDCFNDPNNTEVVSDVEIVDCGETHDNEVYDTFDLADSTFPGQVAVEDKAANGCLSRFEPYVGADYLDSSLEISFLTPSDGSWDDGDREVVCFLYDGTGGTLATSAKGTGI
jgi:hypothetical protein